MKTKLSVILLLLTFSILLFVSCDLIQNNTGNDKSDDLPNEEQNVHTHDYSIRNNAVIYQKSQASCTEAAVYYLSCSCGEKGSETFVDGEALGHVWMRAGCENPLYCDVCHIKDNEPAGHIWQTSEDGKIKTCTSCGAILNLDEHTHSWRESTCTLPKTCSVCGDTEGEAMGHNWCDATCTLPKICSVCGTTEGEPLSHNWEEANCQSAKKCSVCGVTEGELGKHIFVNNSCTICGFIKEVAYTEYTVKVVTAGGMPLEGVVVYVHNSDGYSICTMPVETSENGIATFELETFDGYSIHLENVPLGYEFKEGLTKDDRYLITSSETVIVLTSAPVKTGGFASFYDLGDVMYDFTLTDVNGESYTLSEMLKTKDMVMLNFWFINCIYCEYEFPHINSAYAEYKDSVEILAVNHIPSDTVEEVRAYSERFDVGLDIPLVKVGNTSNDLILSKFPSRGYPTTVIIDRYGVICMIIVGAITNEATWENIFNHFTADDYNQLLITDMSMLG